jgi:hypothetical protein
VRKYDTAWLCEEGRREEAAELVKETEEDRREKSGPQSPGAIASAGNLAALLRYRCEHESR